MRLSSTPFASESFRDGSGCILRPGRRLLIAWLLMVAMLQSAPATTFEEDLAFLKKHLEVIVLADPTGQAQVAVVPAYQGRVMTSTPGGSTGVSCGWLNRALIASRKLQPHINAFGGEDRYWLGPEGGQFSIFFKKGDPFDLTHWQTPAAIDSAAYTVLEKSSRHVTFQYGTELTNYSGRVFALEIVRTIELLSAEELRRTLGMNPAADVRVVAYASDNRLVNMGRDPWTKETGLLSVWILGMFNPSPRTTVVIPYRPGPENKLGPVANDSYFGKVPADRLLIRDGVIYFKGDGQFRSKIGLSPARAKPWLGSYDATQGLLTLVHFNQPAGATDYVNSMWEVQKDPFRGDVVNSYNDGPPTPGAKPLGPFYELETSSPGAALRPGQSLRHVSRTFHFQGPAASLDVIARKTLGVSVTEIQAAFP